MIGMVALKEFTHGGRSFVRGDWFEVPAIDAASLRYQGKAKFKTMPPNTLQTKEEAADPEDNSEQSSPEEQEQDVDDVTDPDPTGPIEAPKPRSRRYRRRDLEAEGRVEPR